MLVLLKKRVPAASEINKYNYSKSIKMNLSPTP